MLKIEDLIPGGKGDNETVKNLAKKHGVPLKHIQNQLKMGLKVEMEHTNNPKKAKEISIDHISENPNYYTKLKSVGLADELDESKTGDFYYIAGNAIDKIESEYEKLNALFVQINADKNSPELKIMKRLNDVIIDLKILLGINK